MEFRRDAFRKTIKVELQDLDRKQIIHFAWLCGVRALPFTGGTGNFNFWKKKEKQKYLYAIFNALDQCAAAYAAAYAADADAADAADAAAYAAYAAAAAARYGIDIHGVLLQDIKGIKKNETGGGGRGVEIYGKVWNNFRQSLEQEGCDYWGRWYQKLFEKGFELSKEDLVDITMRIGIPPEKTMEGAAAVAQFLIELEEKGAERLNEARIIILGDKGSGKTCLARRLVDPKAPMTREEESTPGVDTTIWKLDEERINVHIWDFAGHTITHAVHRFFLSERCLYLIVYDGRCEVRNQLEYWLNHMKNYGGDSKAIILVNKRDKHTPEIHFNTLKEQYPVIDLKVFDIKEDKKELEEFRIYVARFIFNNPSWSNQMIPLNHFRVKEELEKLFEKGKKGKCTEHICREQFDEIAGKFEITNTDGLLSDLHSLGVGLWYKDLGEFDTMVLNPEWISHGIYRIINWVYENKLHSVELKNFHAVFEKERDRFPENKDRYLFSLMKHYQLAYEADGKDRLIIPHLLNIDRPKVLPEFPAGESLMLRYTAEQPLPPDTISRFIVRHNEKIIKEKGKDIVWRYGVVLKYRKSTLALVREEDRTISVSVKGPDKTEFISKLRGTLNEIFSNYRSRKPEIFYRIEDPEQKRQELPSEKPLWLRDEKILNHVLKGKLYWEDITGKHIDLHYTANTYNITIQTLISGGGNQYWDQSKHSTLNCYECNISLQGNLNELAGLLSENGCPQEARELENAAKTLEQVEKSTGEELRKKGTANRIKRIIDELVDENSKLHKTVKGIKNGIKIAQEIAKGYNDIAQWLGWPQVPRPFLGK